MAGDWIKIETATPDKPEVVVIAETLKMDPDAVVGKLIRVWSWADQNSIDGNAITVTESFLDRLTHRKGFATAMRKAGWLAGENGCLNFPGFQRHNGRTAKERADSNRRVAAHRIRNVNVTEKPLQKPLPEKRREEKSLHKSERENNNPPEESPLSLAHVVSSGRRFPDHTVLCARINALRPEWAKPAQWTGAEFHALQDGLAAVSELEEEDWEGLKKYFAASLPEGAGYWQPRSRGQFLQSFSDVFGHYQRWTSKQRHAQPKPLPKPRPAPEPTEEDKAAVAEFISARKLTKTA